MNLVGRKCRGRDRELFGYTFLYINIYNKYLHNFSLRIQIPPDFRVLMKAVGKIDCHMNTLSSLSIKLTPT
jgi:hypothetical protein